METARHHIYIYHVILIGLGQELNLHLLEDDKRATTDLQNGLVVFFLFSLILFCLYELKQ